MIKISICTPVWKRRKMREAYLDHIRSHVIKAGRKGISLTVSISGSEGEETRLEASSRGFAYTEIDNSPLGRKFNASIETAKELFDPDYFMILGSDTFFLPTIWDEYIKYIEEGVEYVGITDLIMHDWMTDESFYWQGYHGKRAGEPIGPGRLIHKNLIPETCFLYDNLLDSSLDASATRRLPKAKTFEARKHLLVSAKGEVNITQVANFDPSTLTKLDTRIISEVYNV